jgi:2,5-diketo-D-gluconate reductase B
MQLKTKSGSDVFPIGIGTWGIASRTSDQQTVYRGVLPSYGNEAAEMAAIKYSAARGQNHVDCAELYGGFYTDEVVGNAISGLPRSELFIADKLWKSSVAKGKVRPAVDEMLKKLKTDYLDLLYIHAPWADTPWPDAIPQIGELIAAGIVRNFGVSNFTVADMKQAANLSKYPIAANQMNYNVLYKQEIDQDFRDYCTAHDIQIVAYQPIKRQAVLHDPTIKRIASAYKATPAQVALAWLLARNALPIPKSIQERHIDENIAATELRLSTSDLDQLDAL